MYPITEAVKALFEAENAKVLRITGSTVKKLPSEISVYNGDELIYQSGDGKHLKLYSGSTEIYDSQDAHVVILYSGTEPIFINDEAGMPIQIEITSDNVRESSFFIDRYSCNGEKLEIGTAIAAEMKLTLDNADGQFDGVVFEGAELFVEVGVADWTQESPAVNWVPCGYFTPDKQPRRLTTITIEALDRMTKFDVVVDAADLTFPATIAGLVSQVCTLCGVTLAQSISRLVNAGVNVAELPTAQGEITYRNLIQWCAGIMGTNAWFDWNGQLRFSWYNNATGYVSTTDNRYSSDLYEDDLMITGVEYTNDSGIAVVEGTDDYAIDLTGNAIAGPLIATVLPPLNTALNGFTYRPFTAAVVNAPYLWPMDVVTFTDKNGKNHTGALTNVAFELNGSTALESKGMTYAINKAAQPKGFTREQARLINAIAQTAITKVDVEYAQNQSTTVAPTSGWSTDAPQWQDGYYIWQRTATTTDSGTTYSAPTCISGRDGVDGATGPQGPQGPQGNTGVGVSGIVEQYYLSISSTTQTGGSWDTTQPEWVSGKYIWTRSQVTWTNGSTTYTSPVLAQAINGANSTANTANNNANAASAAVTALDNSLTQQEIFNRLTDNGAAQGMVLYNGQLYINASYMKSGTIDGNLVNAKLLNIVDANGNVIASFDSTIRLGQSTNAHAEIDFNSFEIKSSSSNSVFFAGDIRDANGRAEVSDSFVGDGTKTLFVLSLHATSITEVKINDVATSEWQLTRDRLGLYFTTAPASGAEIIVSYTTEDEAFRYDIGTRKSGSIIGAGSIAAGKSVESSGTGSYAEGQETHATGYMSHSEGLGSKATGYVSHAEGAYTTASGENSHAEGRSTKASGNYSHAEGRSTKANGHDSHAEGTSTTANGEASHAEGVETIADGFCQHVAGKYNVSDPNKIEIIGNGEYGARSNARTLDWSGNEWIAGALSVGNAAGTRANIGAAPAIQVTTVTDTPDANGNISLRLSAGSYVVVSAKAISLIATPWVSGSDNKWYARITGISGDALTSGSVTVTVYYQAV